MPGRAQPHPNEVTTVGLVGLLSDPDLGAEETLKEWYWEGGVSNLLTNLLTCLIWSK